MSKVQYRKKSTVRTRRAAKKYQPKLMDGDCVFAVPGGTVTAYAAGTLLPAIHLLTFFQEGYRNLVDACERTVLQYCTTTYCAPAT